MVLEVLAPEVQVSEAQVLEVPIAKEVLEVPMAKEVLEVPESKETAKPDLL